MVINKTTDNPLLTIILDPENYGYTTQTQSLGLELYLYVRTAFLINLLLI